MNGLNLIIQNLNMLNAQLYRKTWVRNLQKTNGFFTEYSKSTASEDMAEVYSHMIILVKKINKIRKRSSFK